MTIRINQLKDREFQRDLLLIDYTQDTVISIEDFKIVYGKTASAKHFKAVERAILLQDKQLLDAIINKMAETRNGLFNRRLRPVVRKMADAGLEIKGGKLIFPRIDDPEFNGQESERIRKIFVAGVKTLYEEEFQIKHPEDHSGMTYMSSLSGRIHEPTLDQRLNQLFSSLIGLKGGSDDRPDVLVRGVGDYLFSSSDSHQWFSTHAGGQAYYASFEINEFDEGAEEAAIEKKYSVKILTEGQSFTGEQWLMLDRVLGKLKTLRLADFALISSIAFTSSPDGSRHGAATNPNNAVRLLGAFEPPAGQDAYESSPRYSNAGMKLIYTGDTESYITYILAHEMGHIHKRYNKKAYRLYDKYFQEEGYPEFFAEDYAIYLFSNGREVMRHSGAFLHQGVEYDVPHYEERLALLEEHALLSQERDR